MSRGRKRSLREILQLPDQPVVSEFQGTQIGGYATDYEQQIANRGEELLTENILDQIAEGSIVLNQDEYKYLETYAPFQSAIGRRTDRKLDTQYQVEQERMDTAKKESAQEFQESTKKLADESTRALRRNAILNASRKARERISQQNLSALGRARQGVLSPATGSVGRGISGRQGFASVSNAVLG